MGFFDPFGEAADVGELKSDLNSVKSDVKAHTNNNDIHVTADKKTSWDNAVTNSHTHDNKTVLDGITAEKGVLFL